MRTLRITLLVGGFLVALWAGLTAIRAQLDRLEIEYYVRRYLVRGRESYAESGQAEVSAIVDRLMDELDTNADGEISWGSFSEWNRSSSMEKVVRASLISLQRTESAGMPGGGTGAK